MKPIRILTICLALCATVLVTNTGCRNDVEQTALSAQIILPKYDLKIEEGEAVYFDGAAAGGIPPYRFAWKFGIESKVSRDQKPGQIFFHHEGVYRAIFTVRDAAINTAEDSVLIVVEKNPFGDVVD